MLVGGGLISFHGAAQGAGGWAAMAAANPDRFHLYHPANDPVAPFPGIVLAAFGVFVFYSAATR